MKVLVPGGAKYFKVELLAGPHHENLEWSLSRSSNRERRLYINRIGRRWGATSFSQKGWPRNVVIIIATQNHQHHHR